MEIPVYLFTGFLESGKTTFIQEALEGPDFNLGERTLFLLCEEGEIEYEPDKFFGKNIFFEHIKKEDEITRKTLEELQKKHKVERVIVEYNGMWGLDSFYRAMPLDWLTYQEMMFIDARTFLTYNQNMRQLAFDKLKSAELVVFNRCNHAKMEESDEDGNSLKMQFHKIVRVANRKSQIIYEYGKEDVEMDTIQDPLPYDINDGEIAIKDTWFAEWYRDINEGQDRYDGKILTIRGRVVNGGNIPKDRFIIGRHLMTCCVDDIQFAGLVCKWTNDAATLINGNWYTVTAKVKVEEDLMYAGTGAGPVLYCTKVDKAAPAVPEVATF